MVSDWGRFSSYYAKAWEAVQKAALPQVLLLTGREGLGKGLFARGLVALLFCERQTAKPCGSCRLCLSIKGDHFPDLLWISAQGQRIKADDVTRVQDHLSLKPRGSTLYPKGYRVVVIEDIDWMTHYGVNALLKTIEEPPPDSLLIFTTSKKRQLMPTLLSRCVQWALIPNKLGITSQVIKPAFYQSNEDLAKIIQRFESMPKGEVPSPATFVQSVEYVLNQNYRDFFLQGKKLNTHNLLVKKRRIWLQEMLHITHQHIAINTQGMAEYLGALEANPQL